MRNVHVLDLKWPQAEAETYRWIESDLMLTCATYNTERGWMQVRYSGVYRTHFASLASSFSFFSMLVRTKDRALTTSSENWWTNERHRPNKKQ